MNHPAHRPPDGLEAPTRRRWLQDASLGIGGLLLPPPLATAALGATAWALGGCAHTGHDTGHDDAGAPLPAGDGPAMDAVTPFSTHADAGGLPQGWHPYVLRRDLPRTRYDTVREGERTVLRARARRSATGLHCSLKPTRAQRLRFSWKVARAVEHARIDAAELDDAPARVIVAFDGDHRRLSLRDRLLFDQVELFTGHRLPYSMLMYVWTGSQLPVETLHRNHRTARIQYLAVESGPARAGRWLHYERQLELDHRRAFGEAPGPVIGVGVLTDGDALKLDFDALYGDITLEPPGAG